MSHKTAIAARALAKHKQTICVGWFLVENLWHTEAHEEANQVGRNV
jgi:hypothetical protein